jgi:hypothetical protein
LWECQSRLLLTANDGTEIIGGEVPTAEVICGTTPVDVKGKMHEAVNFGGENKNEAGEIPQKQGRKHD